MCARIAAESGVLGFSFTCGGRCSEFWGGDVIMNLCGRCNEFWGGDVILGILFRGALMAAQINLGGR